MELTENAFKIANKRYFKNEENWDKCALRVAEHVSSIENNKKKYYKDKFYEIIFNMDFLPAGRILRNSGRLKGSLFNCYNIPIGDSIEEIGQFLKECLILWSEGGGCGTNFTPLRPKGDKILGKGGISSGLVSFIEASNAVSKTIESGGSRRAAALALVSINHPEVIEFIDSKLIHGKLSGYNISVSINDSFLEHVERNKDWTFSFKQKKYNKINAREIWNKILENMVKVAEPGLINWNNLIKNNSYYFDSITGCNPCAEAVLEDHGVCDLGSIVLPNFIIGNINTNWKKLEDVIKLSVRFLDNIIDVNNYVIPKTDIKAHNSRRIGLGVIGLAEYLFEKKVRYGSEKSIIEIEKLMKFIRNCTYQTLVELSIEKGAFPKFDSVPYGKASFIRKLPVSLRLDIKKYGTRCVTGLAIAPTGTISLVADCTSSIEPLFSKGFKRHDKVGDRIYIHKIYEDLLLNNKKIPDWYVDTFDLKPEDHFEVQCAVQKYVDGAVSKTINLPEHFTSDQLSDLLLEYIRDTKGCTVYRDNCRPEQILNKITKEEAIQYLKENNKINNLNENEVKCSKGTCEI